MRGWSDVEDNVHLAFYEFPTLAAANKLFFLSTELEAEALPEVEVVPLLTTFCEAVSHAESKSREEIAVAIKILFFI